MRSIMLLTLLTLAMTLIEFSAQDPKAKIIETLDCKLVQRIDEPGQPRVVKLDCGTLQTGDDLTEVVIPETLIQFGLGEVFRFYLYSDGNVRIAERQPTGSSYRITLPCAKRTPVEKRDPPNPGPCNPDEASYRGLIE